MSAEGSSVPEGRESVRDSRGPRLLRLVGGFSLVFLILALQLLQLARLDSIEQSLTQLWTSASGLRSGRGQASGKGEAALPSRPIPFSRTAIKGSPASRVAIIGYSDFQCPYCAKFAESTLPEIERTYLSGGQVLFAFKHLPLTRIHKSAQDAAQAADCAGREGQFWPMHDLMFRQPRDLDEPALLKLAATLRLDGAGFRNCLTGDVAPEIAANVLEAKEFGISGTPTFFVGVINVEGTVDIVRRLSGNQSFAQFQTAIDESLAATNRSR